ncbi:MAG TPA: hypothetical protein VNP72_09205 [Longimicrobium sp.]|nr:hypothetical protein [Longimicrobium sp.]
MTDARTLSPQDRPATARATGDQAASTPRAPYQRPALERLGAWSARTLQMTIIIEPF